jgi:hypothetical protein
MGQADPALETIHKTCTFVEVDTTGTSPLAPIKTLVAGEAFCYWDLDE